MLASRRFVISISNLNRSFAVRTRLQPTLSLAYASMDLSRPFSSSSPMLSDRPPTRDGDELIQPLESADLRGFWDNAPRESADPSTQDGSSRSNDPKAVAKSLHDLVVKIVDKKAHKGTKAVGQIVQEFCDLYETQDVAARTEFLALLSHVFCKPRGKASEAARAYLDSTSISVDPAQSALQAHILRDSLTPSYADLFDQINRLPEGFAFLVHMRTDMLGFIRAGSKDSAIQAMSDFLMRRLQMWIVGTLDLKRITWNSPACTIEKLEQYESVHAVRSWMDIKRRLGNGRRCFGFFHRNAPREPLIFVWVALTDVIPENVQTILLEREQPKSSEANAKCAIFYSISSQVGLARVDLGNFLIKRVVSVLRTEIPNIETFCTLSPLPRFRSWLDKLLSPENLESPPQDIGISQSEQNNLIRCVPGAKTWTSALKSLVDRRGWTADPEIVDAMEPVIRLLGAYYLIKVKRRTSNSAADPVANFHLRNGSCLHRVNWRGDTSYHGLRQSLGLMCNYNYILDRIEENSESYVVDGKIAISGSDPYIARVQSLPKAKL